MLVRDFLQFVQSAGPAARAEAVAGFARLYLDHAIVADDAEQAEAALVLLLDDKDAGVRRAMAQVLAPSDAAPYPVVMGLMQDEPSVAAIVARHSPLLPDADLMELVERNDTTIQIAVADRTPLSAQVAALIARKGGPEACLVLLENGETSLDADALNAIVERHGDDIDVREALLARGDLPVSTQQSLIVKMSSAFSTAQGGTARQDRLSRDACERATIALALRLSGTAPHALVRHLIDTEQMTASFLLRVVLSANFTLFEAALAALTGFSPERVAGLVHDRRGAGFKALYEAAGLPPSAFPAFASAIATWHEDGMVWDEAPNARLKRRMVERALTGCAKHSGAEVDHLFGLLRRFQAETLRDDARLLAEQLAGGEPQAEMPEAFEPAQAVVIDEPLDDDIADAASADIWAREEEPAPAYVAEVPAVAFDHQEPEPAPTLVTDKVAKIAAIEATASRIQDDLTWLLAERMRRHSEKLAQQMPPVMPAQQPQQPARAYAPPPPPPEPVWQEQWQQEWQPAPMVNPFRRPARSLTRRWQAEGNLRPVDVSRLWVA